MCEYIEVLNWRGDEVTPVVITVIASNRVKNGSQLVMNRLSSVPPPAPSLSTWSPD
jgi:hypothetical protein